MLPASISFAGGTGSGANACVTSAQQNVDDEQRCHEYVERALCRQVVLPGSAEQIPETSAAGGVRKGDDQPNEQANEDGVEPDRNKSGCG